MAPVMASASADKQFYYMTPDLLQLLCLTRLMRNKYGFPNRDWQSAQCSSTTDDLQLQSVWKDPKILIPSGSTVRNVGIGEFWVGGASRLSHPRTVQ